MRSIGTALAAAAALAAAPLPGRELASAQTVFTNVNDFDAVNEEPIENTDEDVDPFHADPGQPKSRLEKAAGSGKIPAKLKMWHGNPLEDIDSIVDHENLKVVMKDGKVNKNSL